jgi:two-component system, cell cycle response regulator
METENERLKVLLVDDDSFVHEMMEMLLTGTEFSLLSATSVQEAMQITMTEIPDIIITDAIMPGEGGFSFIEKLKSDPRTVHTPIILLTILQQLDGNVMDASGKADICVPKPLYLSDILSGLERAKELIEHYRVVNVQMPEPPDPVKFVF